MYVVQLDTLDANTEAYRFRKIGEALSRFAHEVRVAESTIMRCTFTMTDSQLCVEVEARGEWVSTILLYEEVK